mmetsp:Transcript_31411/g.50399  ORF Transcript_31411/g.50399 Transcript_31411/m.50399 type:complete len:152 (+) Transcript_31411:63-518(+)
MGRATCNTRLQLRNRTETMIVAPELQLRKNQITERSEHRSTIGAQANYALQPQQSRPGSNKKLSWNQSRQRRVHKVISRYCLLLFSVNYDRLYLRRGLLYDTPHRNKLWRQSDLLVGRLKLESAECVKSPNQSYGLHNRTTLRLRQGAKLL